MKKIFLFISLFLVNLSLFSQSASALEKKLSEASSANDKMELKYELAKIYAENSSSRAKALTYIKEAYQIANSQKDNFMMAKIAFLDGEVHAKKRDKTRAVSRYKVALDNAKRAGDGVLAIESAKRLAAIYAQTGNYKDAYSMTREALKNNSKGGVVSNSGSKKKLNRLITEKKKLENENRRLEKDKRALKEEVFGLQNKLKTGNAELTPEQRRILEELGEKEKMLEDLAVEKAESDAQRKRLEKKYAQLSKEEMKKEALVKEQEAELLKAEMEQEKQNNFRNILIGAIGSLILFAFLMFGRLRANRRAKIQIEEKSKTIDEERKRSEELLLNILPASIANELKEKGKVKAKKFNEVSVLFTDFKNFSGIAEKMTADELVNELDHCFKAFDYIISQYDSIEKIKTIGDSYMCAFGLNAKKANATDLAKAAMEMQDFMKEYKTDRINNGKPFFEARIGIHTGPVVAGIVGFNKFAYDIWGDTVNIASRMESNGEVGRVNISESTYNKIRSQFQCEHRGKISAKNKGQIDMYFIK